mmetsp:Transcript_5458/g.9722  ORF Transcript_5458/g.9722 Transcript_5458/m.9722 type:complete len:192 (-) Transcript_5458:297-872(-)|eukprot:CAMPEP_0184702748 /NCGR_PEP_ID=MMETSP0313-20130426/25344_1 /TAXON_ID=2792 /ORGANISM="Porphyridium aerugineum, Strain SAG 1380-2" /LENGTH=191 /DNA_ID=CAMNT_0027163317 /DNA_START=149 /DNA_END=724 /DNA_ORIENTATION=+
MEHRQTEDEARADRETFLNDSIEANSFWDNLLLEPPTDEDASLTTPPINEDASWVASPINEDASLTTPVASVTMLTEQPSGAGGINYEYGDPLDKRTRRIKDDIPWLYQQLHAATNEDEKARLRVEIRRAKGREASRKHAAKRKREREQNQIVLREWASSLQNRSQGSAATSAAQAPDADIGSFFDAQMDL